MKIIKSIFFLLLFVNSISAGIIKGHFQTDYYGNIEPTTPYSNQRLRLYLQPVISEKLFNHKFSFLVSGNLFYQPIGKNYPTIGKEGFVSLDYLVREAYLGFHFSFFDLFLGQKFVNWGKVDVLSPLNVINPSDLTVLSPDNTEESSLADPLAQVQIYLSSELNVEFVYVPFFQPSIYPISEIEIKTNIPTSLFSRTSIYDIDASFINKKIKPYRELCHSLHSSLNYMSDLIDITAAYSYYKDHLFDFDLTNLKEDTIIGTSTNIHQITGDAYPAYHYIHKIGLAGSYDHKGYDFNLDTSLLLTEDKDGSRMDIKNNEIFNTIQVGHKFINKLYTQLNLVHRLILSFDADIQSEYSIVVQNFIKSEIDKYFFQQSKSQLYLLIHADMNYLYEKLFLGINIIHGMAEKESYCSPRISYKLSDYITCYAGTDIWFGGEGDGFLSRNQLNDNFHVKLKIEI